MHSVPRGHMRLRTVILFLPALFSPNVGHSQNHALEFVKQIGGGWHTDRFGWMGFVQFSSDGELVASDADPLSAPAWISDNINVPIFHLFREGVSRTCGL